VPEDELREDHIIPSAFNRDVAVAVAQAVAAKAKATGVGEAEKFPGFAEQDTASHSVVGGA
jgi:malate dehydrogenase (oxaloacetate-decarboxylating)